MASIQEVLSRAMRHLGDLTLSQRLAIGMGALLVAGSLIWLGQWAATPDMVPLLDQKLDADELAMVRSGLEAMGEPYKVSGAQVLVRAAANRQAILASLQQAEKLPPDTAIGFAQLVKEANPWISGQENNRRWTVAVQNELARVLREFNGVRRARVMLNLNARPRGFSRSQPESTASVTLFTRGGEPVTRALALAAARMVAGAVRGLPVKNVQVIDGANGRVALDWDDVAGGGASGLHRQRKQLEHEKEAQIRELLGFDPHVLVSVSAELDFSSVQEQNTQITEGVKVKKESDTTTTHRGRTSGQPGAQPNVGMAVSGGANAETSNTEHTQEVSEPSRLTSVKQTPAGVPKSISAAVSLSYSYLASVYKRNNPQADKPPTEADIEKVFQKQKASIVELLARLVLPQDKQQVSVAWHYDVEPEDAAAAAGGTLDTSLELASRYGPASGLGLLALLSLGLMLRMAKQKSAGETFGMEIGLPKEAIEAARNAARKMQAGGGKKRAAGRAGGGVAVAAGGFGAGAAEPAEAIPSAPIPVGQEAEGVLEAQEVDESAVQIEQIIAQVSEIAKQDGESVATLIENWIDHSI